MTFYETIDGEHIPLSILKAEEQKVVTWLQNFVRQATDTLTRTQLQTYWSSFFLDANEELRLLNVSQDHPIGNIVIDLRDRLGIIAGLEYTKELAGHGLTAKEWTGRSEGHVCAFYVSFKESAGGAPLSFGNVWVPVFDTEEGGFKSKTEKIEQAKGRTTVGVWKPQTAEINSFLISLSHEYGLELDQLLSEIIRLGYENGCAHYFEDPIPLRNVLANIRTIPFLQRLEREVGPDIHSLVFEIVCDSTRLGKIATSEGFY